MDYRGILARSVEGHNGRKKVLDEQYSKLKTSEEYDTKILPHKKFHTLTTKLCISNIKKIDYLK